MDVNKDYNKYYEKIGNQYNKIRLDAKNDRENVIQIIKKHANSKHSKILDIGCGTGKYGEMMQKNGYEVIGLDISETQIMQAKQLIEAYQGNAIHMPFEDNSFDVCTMIIMIQQLSKEDRKKAFQEVYRVLKTNGVLIIKTCSHKDLQYRFTAKFFPKTLEIDKARYPDIEELKEELLSFTKIQIESTSIIIEKSKEKYLEQYRKRGTSNFSFLSDAEICEGIKKFEETFKGQEKIQKVTKNTFVIAKKE